jgi:steroid delta-isomerase-like uncharacterized protein
MPHQAQDLVRRLIGAINNQDYEALPDLVDPEYVYRAPGEELRGVAGLKSLLTAYHRGFPDLELVIDDMFGEENRVATAFTFTGTHLGELMGVPATGKRVSVHGTIHSRVEGGRIVEEWELLDLATMYQQLGLAEGH